VGAGLQLDLDIDELAARAAEFETAPAGKVIGWAIERYGRAVSLACSFQDCVIVDLAVQADPDIEVIFLDTGFHFGETLAYVEEVRARYDLNLRVMRPGPDAVAWPCGSDRCCELRKVEPLQRALEGATHGSPASSDSTPPPVPTRRSCRGIRCTTSSR
jgi:phosphoadenosine phosphosulfate reductase